MQAGSRDQLKGHEDRKKGPSCSLPRTSLSSDDPSSPATHDTHGSWRGQASKWQGEPRILAWCPVPGETGVPEHVPGMARGQGRGRAAR